MPLSIKHIHFIANAVKAEKFETENIMISFDTAIDDIPIIAALRGIKPGDIDDIVPGLINNGICALEVPVRNKNDLFGSMDDQALESLEYLLTHYSTQAHICAGTVLVEEDLKPLSEMGFRFFLSPWLDEDIVAAARRQDLAFIPGIQTMSEASRAVQAGASGLKLFPAAVSSPDGSYHQTITPGHVAYIRKFFKCPLYPSGDFRADPSLYQYIHAGATAINISSQLYTPQYTGAQVTDRARNFSKCIKDA